MTPPAGRGQTRRSTSLLRAVLELPFLLLCAAVIAFLLKTLVAQAFYIPSESMTPQLEVNDRVLVSKLAYRLHPPHRGDIVVFDCPQSSCPEEEESGSVVVRVLRAVAEGVGVIQPSTEEFIKRVIGLPGETLEARGGQVYVNGRRLIEPYLPAGTRTASLPLTRVPAGRLFVMGDNRDNSSDSRVFGPIPRSTVVGRTILKVWPPASASFL